MAVVSGGGVAGGGVPVTRLVGVGALTVALAVVANVAIRTVAVSVLGIGEGFQALWLGPTVTFTVIGVTGAVVVFGIVLRFARRPVRLFWRIAVVVLVISLVPDVLLLFSSPIPGTTTGGVLTLMLEHVASWAVVVSTLPRLTVGRGRRG